MQLYLRRYVIWIKTLEILTQLNIFLPQMSEEQIRQLYDLMHAAKNVWKQPPFENPAEPKP